MPLSVELFEELTRSATSAPSQGGNGAEKRRSARVEVSLPVTAMRLRDGVPEEPVSVSLCDLSPRGARLVGTVPLGVRTHIILIFPRTGGGEPLHVLSEVVHQRRDPEGRVVCGVQFICPVNAAHAAPQLDAADDGAVARIRGSILG